MMSGWGITKSITRYRSGGVVSGGGEGAERRGEGGDDIGGWITRSMTRKRSVMMGHTRLASCVWRRGFSAVCDSTDESTVCEITEHRRESRSWVRGNRPAACGRPPRRSQTLSKPGLRRLRTILGPTRLRSGAAKEFSQATPSNKDAAWKCCAQTDVKIALNTSSLSR